MKRFAAFVFLLLVPAVAFSAARPAPLPESRLTGMLHGEGQTITNVANVVTSNGVSLLGLSASKADSSALAATSNTLSQAVALKADASALSTTSNSLAQAVSLKASTSALSTTSNALAQAVALKADASALAATSNTFAQATALKANASDLSATSNTFALALGNLSVGDPAALSGNLLVTSTAPLTLVVSNGLVYAVLPNGDVVDVTYYLPAYAVTEPTTNYPAGFAAFDFEANTTNVSAYAPQIAEWTRQNQPGDTMALTAENLNPTNSLFVFSDDGSEVVAGDILVLDDRQCAVTLPDGLTSNAFYLAWPYNSEGFGEPVGINQTELWWVGINQVSTGDIFYAYGRNLLLGSGDCSLYIAELNRWLTSTTNSNPYKAEFTMPTDVSNGTYTLYAHNGHGGKYGWSNPQAITVVSPVLYDAGTMDMVSDFGANGSDGLSDQAAFDACTAYADANPGTVVTIPAGTYHLTGFFDVRPRTKYVGAGTNQTFITAITPRTATNVTAAALMICRDKNAVHDLSIDVTDDVVVNSAIYISSASSDSYFENVRFTQNKMTRSAGFISMSNAKRVRFKNCTFISRRGLGIASASQVRIEDCYFLGSWDNNQLVTPEFGSSFVDISGCVASGLDQSDPSTGAGWCKGRFIVDKGANGFYFGENQTIDMHVRQATPFTTNMVVNGVNAYADYSLQQVITCADIPAELDGFGEDDAWINSGANGSRLWVGIVSGVETNYQIRGLLYTDATANTFTIYATSSTTLPTNGTVVVAAPADYVDSNSGEQYLFEGPKTAYFGKAVSSSSNTVVFGDGVNALSKVAVGHMATIVGGKGLGQSRVVASEAIVNTTQGQFTLDSAWRVLPDSTSAINIGVLSRNNAIYQNEFEGNAYAHTVSTASSGVAMWGSSGTTDVIGNSFDKIRYAIHITPYGNSVAGMSYMCQSLFNLIDGNNFSDNYIDILRDDLSSNGPATDVDVTFLGNVYRRNRSTGTKYAFLKSSLAANIGNQGQLSIWQDNVVSNAASVVLDSTNLVNQVWISNTLQTTNSVGWRVSTGNTLALVGNEWSVDEEYVGATPGAVLQIPQSTVLLSDASKTIQLLNTGTTGLTYTATDNAAWLSVTASGAIAAESSGDMVLSRSGSTTNGATALVSVVAAGQTNVFTVVYGTELGVE